MNNKKVKKPIQHNAIRCMDHTGQVFESFEAMCRRWGKREGCVRRRLDAGMPLAEALTRKVLSSGGGVPITDHHGETFATKAAVCQRYMLDAEDFRGAPERVDPFMFAVMRRYRRGAKSEDIEILEQLRFPSMIVRTPEGEAELTVDELVDILRERGYDRMVAPPTHVSKVVERCAAEIAAASREKSRKDSAKKPDSADADAPYGDTLRPEARPVTIGVKLLNGTPDGIVKARAEGKDYSVYKIPRDRVYEACRLGELICPGVFMLIYPPDEPGEPRVRVGMSHGRAKGIVDAVARAHGTGWTEAYVITSDALTGKAEAEWLKHEVYTRVESTFRFRLSGYDNEHISVPEVSEESVGKLIELADTAVTILRTMGIDVFDKAPRNISAEEALEAARIQGKPWYADLAVEEFSRADMGVSAGLVKINSGYLILAGSRVVADQHPGISKECALVRMIAEAHQGVTTRDIPAPSYAAAVEFIMGGYETVYAPDSSVNPGACS